MKNLIFKKFGLLDEKENYRHVTEEIEKDATFAGSRLWILIFAILVASLGLNINSTAVIIGAMLISPLMGPIMGIGLSVGVYDFALLRLAVFNYLFAVGVGLASSTLYFTITPLDIAHSEILARTSPNIYDVLIAIFGGFAGVLATAGKYKGNVIPGVAIATALMPPLCTAGYGLATHNLNFFLGAFYLFLINSVFIAWATFVTVRLLKYPTIKLADTEVESKTKRILWGVVVITLLPSIYLGYLMVLEERFRQNAVRFIQEEAHFSNDYLLESNIDPKTKAITLTFGGKKIHDTEIAGLKSKLPYYSLGQSTLTVRQGFEYLSEAKPRELSVNPLSSLLAEKEQALQGYLNTADSLQMVNTHNAQTIEETKALFPALKAAAITELSLVEPDTSQAAYLVYMSMETIPPLPEKKRLEAWLETKLRKKVRVVFDKYQAAQ